MRFIDGSTTHVEHRSNACDAPIIQESNLQAAETEEDCHERKSRAGRTETADQGDAVVSGTAVYRGHGI